MTQFYLTETRRVPDGFGGFIEDVVNTLSIDGVLDMLTHNAYNQNHNAMVEDSSHIFIADYFDDYDDALKVGSILKSSKKSYRIIYVDNPLEENSHLEIYLKFEGDN